MRVRQEEEVAEKMDIAEFGYAFRIINNGPDVGQEVPHLRVMGGKRMGMP